MSIDKAQAADKKITFDKSGRPKSDNPETRLPVVSSDVDGVWANWTQAILDLQGKGHNWQEWTNWYPWKIEPEPIMGEGQFKALFAETIKTPEFHRRGLKLFQGMSTARVQDSLDSSEYLLYLVTHRPNIDSDEGITDACRLTQQWFADQGITNPTGVIAGHHNRTDLLKLLEVDYHIDDYGDEFLKLRDAGINAYLIDRPWNRYIETEYRVASFDEFLAQTVYKKELKLKAV